MTRRQAVALTTGTVAFAAQPRQNKPVKRPNIVFVMADDLGYADLSCYGRREYRTVNIDSLATGGVRFLQAYANSAVCSATRTALMTGRYQYRFRVGLEEPLRNVKTIGLPPDTPTLPALLKNAGYRTTLVGKWHLGQLPAYGPLKSGYEHFWGFRGPALDYFTHKNGANDDLWEDDVEIHRAGYLTDLLGERAVQCIREYAAESQPFFLSLHFNAPHFPWEAPGDEAESQKALSLFHYDGGSQKTYERMVLQLDNQVGRVLTALQEAGIAENTIVVFTSDNGGERFSDTWPFSGKKTELLEGGLRIPALVRWPGHIRAGGTTAQVSISMDWVPTLLAAAGVAPDPASPMDGLNLLPQLTMDAIPTKRALFWRYHFNAQRAMREGNMKYLRIADNEFLFNVVDDPLERANLKERQPDTFRRMVSSYEEWNASMLPDRPDIQSGPLAYSDELADQIGVTRPNGKP